MFGSHGCPASKVCERCSREGGSYIRLCQPLPEYGKLTNNGPGTGDVYGVKPGGVMFYLQGGIRCGYRGFMGVIHPMDAWRNRLFDRMGTC